MVRIVLFYSSSFDVLSMPAKTYYNQMVSVGKSDPRYSLVTCSVVWKFFSYFTSSR